jgi:acyl-CoA thioesterase
MGEPQDLAPDEAQKLAERVVQTLFERDRASQALGIEVLEVRPGHIRAAMSVRADMLNGHDTCHGGFVFSLADSAFAFCCNSFNLVTVAAGATIDFLAPARKGDRLVAMARQLWRSKRTGLYEIEVTNQDGAMIALFRGRSHQLQGQVLADAPIASPALAAR